MDLTKVSVTLRPGEPTETIFADRKCEPSTICVPINLTTPTAVAAHALRQMAAKVNEIGLTASASLVLASFADKIEDYDRPESRPMLTRLFTGLERMHV